MNLLIIDNGTIHLEEFKTVLSDHNCVFLSKDEFANIQVEDFDAVILSGSSANSAIKHRYLFTHQIDLIKSCRVPILGVCLGFELMIDAFGGSMIRLKDKIQEVKTLQFSSDPIFEGISELHVYEGHRWITQQAPDIFTVLAQSETGIEVIKHKEVCMYGLQFHPEVMIENTNGDKVLKNFVKIVANRQH